MRLAIGFGVLALAVGATVAQAEVSLHDVPALCGPSVEILDTLGQKMPDPVAIGTGGDSRGEKVATLFVGNGYWALLALVSPERVCVVASGHDWTSAASGVSDSY